MFCGLVSLLTLTVSAEWKVGKDISVWSLIIQVSQCVRKLMKSQTERNNGASVVY